jgi:GNAT superfamily N-acetyltransferase
MKTFRLPDGARIESLRRSHPRRAFSCDGAGVDDWLRTKALQQQDKRLSVTRVLLNDDGKIVGFYTLATGQIDFGDLPPQMVKHLPQRALPVAVLAWLGVDHDYHRQGWGRLLLAQALRDCYESGRTFAFVAVILDCIDDKAGAFYRKWDFQALPGYRNRLFLSWRRLEAMMTAD